MLLKEIKRSVPPVLISPEHTELVDLLQMTHGRRKDNESTYYQQSSEKAKQINKEKEAAEDMRKNL